MSETKATYKVHVSPQLKKIVAGLSFNFDDIQNDLADIATAGVFTVILISLVLAYISTRLPAWPGIGEFAGYYIAFNFVMLVRFIISRARNAWTTDELGNEIHNLSEYIKQRGG